MSYPLRQSTASQEVPLGPFLDSGDGNTIEDGLTIANTDIRLTKHGGTTHGDKHSGGATHDANGVYYCTLDATDTDTAGGLVINCHVAGALAVRLECVVYPAQIFDSLFSSDYLQVDAVQVEGGDATNAIRDALVDDATRIDASALNTLSGHDPGETIMGATDLGTGSGLTAVPWNAAWDAEVQSECADALAAYDPPTAAELTNGLAALNDLDAAGVRSAVGLASANLDTQLGAIDTNVDAVLADTGTDGVVVAAASKTGYALAAGHGLATAASIAALNDIDTDDVEGAVGDALTDYGAAKASELPGAAPSAADNATAVWEYQTRELTSAGAGGATAQEVWGYQTRSVTDKSGFSLAAGHGLATSSEVAKDATVAKAAAMPSAADNATAVWAAGTRTLTSFGSLVADVATAVWGAAQRTLTAFGFTPTPSNAADVTAVKERTDRLPNAPASQGDVVTVGSAVSGLNNLSQAQAQTAAAAALAAYDPPTRAEATADKNEIIDAIPSGSDAPTAGEVADAVWDEATADHAIAGSTGAAVTAAGVAGDPWTAELPGDYADGTAGAILPDLQSGLTALGASEVTVTNPVAESGDVTLYRGDDYESAHGRALTFTVADDAHALGLDDVGAAVRVKCSEATWTATSVTETEAGYTVVFEPTAAATGALSAGTQSYELEATLASGHVVTLATGTLTVRRDIPEVS